MAPYVEGLRALGLAATAIDLPKRRAEEAVPALLRVVPPTAEVVIGGHSYGGRVASLAAAGLSGDGRPAFAGLVLLSYPLHRPGRPDLEGRTAHWPAIDCPVLLLSGESDPFAQIGLLREAVGRLAQAELVTYPRLGHGLLAVRDDVVGRVAAFVRQLDST